MSTENHTTDNQASGATTPPDDKFMSITEDEFHSQYGPLLANHIDSSACWNCVLDDANPGCMFETYGPEVEFVATQDPRRVWTLVDTDEGEVIISGLHHVNRLGYFISSVPVPDGLSVEVKFDHGEPDDDYWEDDDDEGVDVCTLIDISDADLEPHSETYPATVDDAVEVRANQILDDNREERMPPIYETVTCGAEQIDVLFVVAGKDERVIIDGRLAGPEEVVAFGAGRALFTSEARTGLVVIYPERRMAFAVVDGAVLRLPKKEGGMS